MILIVHRLAWNKSAFKGIKKNIYILAELARNWILQLIYGFDRWHVVCGYHRVEYKKALIEKINSKEYEVVLEVGCGLADILTRLKAPRKIGIDIDHKVIRAANFIHPKLYLVVGNFIEDCELIIASMDYVKLDAVIFANWVHSIPFDQFIKIINILKNDNKYLDIYIDIIEVHAREYKYHHKNKLISKFPHCSIYKLDDDRSVMVV